MKGKSEWNVVMLMAKLLDYEAAKKELLKKMLTAWEYEQELRKLAKKHRI